MRWWPRFAKNFSLAGFVIPALLLFLAGRLFGAW